MFAINRVLKAFGKKVLANKGQNCKNKSRE